MSDWRKRFWQTTGSGYISLILRMVLGLVMFRLMFEKFSDAQFGFWALLWSLFGYGILLDFGFGFTAQKAVASKTATGDMQGLNRLLSTIFWTFIGLAVVLFVIFFFLRGSFLAGMKVAAGDLGDFQSAYLVFFLGLAVMFPLGLFPEILRGLQRIDIANWNGVVATLLNFGALWYGLHQGWSLAALMAVSVTTTALPNLLSAAYVFRHLPELSLKPSGFEWSAVKSQMGFSVVAYLITFSNMLMGKSDQLVISLTIGVAYVAVYQAGFKASEMLGMFSSQMQQALSPAAASMHAQGDVDGLQRLLLGTSRLIFFLVTPCYVLAAVYLEPLIGVLTGMTEVPRETYWVGQALLFATYSSQMTSGSSKRVLMMCGEERALLKISLWDALANVVISILLAYRLGVLGVALGTMIPTFFFGWCWVVPFTMKRLGIGWRSYLHIHSRGTLWPLAIFVLFLATLLLVAPLTEEASLWALGWRAALCFVPFLWLGRKVLRP
ncbi:MAG: hypothetical protein EAZ81_02265 [Verrucomicrobia bacterium]|nr:MAG: hypothetical protein EAZ81_02265 [Verrucomicrobiota bacterium]